MNRSESISKLAVSLVKFNSEVSKIAKDASNPFFKSNYVTLDRLIEATRPILQENGLVVMQSPLSKEDGSIGIQTLLIHESGEFIESEPIFMKPAKANDPQQAGSIISYMRRYSYQAILNLNTGEDDDANKSTGEENIKAKINNKSNVVVLSEDKIKELYKVGYSAGYTYPKVDNLVAQRCNKKTNEMTEEEYNTILNELKRIVDAKNKVGA
jgi:hypothetical protein